MKKVIYIILLVFIFHKTMGQDVQFTQFYANSLYLAPSFAGATEDFRVAANYRSQWTAIPGAFNTYTFSADHYFSNFNSGAGIFFMRDAAGAGNLGLTSIGIHYSFDFNIDEIWHIRPGLHFDYLQLGINWDKLNFTSPTEQSPEGAKGDVDFGTSILVYRDRVWGGVAVDHLLKPNMSFYGDQSLIPLKYSVFGGVQILKRGRLLQPVDETVSLAFLFRNQGKDNQLDLGLYWYKYPLILGVWYRGIPPLNGNRGDAIALLVGFKTKYLHIGYSYDFTVSNLISSTNGSHEVSLVYEFKVTPRKKRPHAIPCPEF